mmetsp:Transcript_22822/g.64603  ORF Transcript_22822/g.64603 Transcript_22822/m.64603 type:complete len:293 (-) Transcript_22822:95-973(-)
MNSAPNSSFVAPNELSLFTAWRPMLSESSDGKPLATNASQLLASFPYDRLPSNPYLSFFLRPEGLAAMLAFYLVSKPIMKAVFPLSPKSPAFRNAVAIHNLALAVFSAVVAWNAWIIAFQHTMTHGAFDTYCDPDGRFWNESGFGPWAIIFYISKFYEFVDTWILVWKEKEPSFLQVYHHTGIAICMWLGVVHQAAWLLVPVTLNGMIHTLMYTYFFIKTVSPTTEIKSAKYLTWAQIGQFIVGIIWSSGCYVLGDECYGTSSKVSLVAFHLYACGLIVLFSLFSKRKYKKP